jgi:hypothetical protein
MELKQVIGNRRSIRYFEPDKPVEKEKIQVILDPIDPARRAAEVRQIAQRFGLPE